MKKIFTLISAFAAVTAVQAQTITSASFPTVGETWIEFNDQTGGTVNITPGGAGQSWNYSTSFTVSDTDAVFFQSIFDAPSYINIPTIFPAGNSMDIGIQGQDTMYSIYKYDATGFYLDGFYQANLINDPSVGLVVNYIDYSPDRLVIPAPFSLNDIRTNNARYDMNFTASGFNIGIKSYTMQTLEADANGTLTTPMGTFNDVLRIREFNYIIDSTTYNSPLIADVVNLHDTTITYTFVHANSHCVLMTAQVDPISMQVTDASYFDPIVLTGVQANETVPVTIDPNPAVDAFYLNHIRNNSTMQIFDVAGKLVKLQSLAGLESSVKVNTSDMQAGLYFFTLTNAENGQYFSSKFQVSK